MIEPKPEKRKKLRSADGFKVTTIRVVQVGSPGLCSEPARPLGKVLIVFVIVASFSSHAYWTVPEAQRANQSSHFWNNITIIGGLVMQFVTAAGRLSIDRLLSRRDS